MAFYCMTIIVFLDQQQQQQQYHQEEDLDATVDYTNTIYCEVREREEVECETVCSQIMQLGTYNVNV